MFDQVRAPIINFANVNNNGNSKADNKVKINLIWAVLQEDDIRLELVNHRGNAGSSPTPKNRVSIVLIHRMYIHTAQSRDNTILKPVPIASLKPSHDTHLKAPFPEGQS
jgi:hypothetical protein